MYFDGDKPHTTPSTKRIHIMTIRPTENQIYQKRKNDCRSDIVVKEVEIREIKNDI